MVNLKHLDHETLGAFHIRTVIVSGIGFLTDAYDLFIISIVSPILGIVYYQGWLDPVADGWLKSSAAWGTLLGQLLFGFLADKLGRKSMYGVVLMIIIGGTLLSCLSVPINGNILVMLILSRALLGIGIGGDYPLSGVITSEFANSKNRGTMIAAVFAMQGIGILLGALVSVGLLAMFRTRIQNDTQFLDFIWRACVAIGIIPGLGALYFRLQIPESPRFTKDVIKDQEQAARDLNHILKDNANHQLLASQQSTVPVMESMSTSLSDIDEERLLEEDEHPQLQEQLLFWNYFSQWPHLQVLLGTSLTWFLLDIGFYGTNLNTPIILKALGLSEGKTPFDQIWHIAVGNLAIAMLGSVPGYWVTVFLIEKLGRRRIQFLGFGCLTVLFALLAMGYKYLLEIQFYSMFIFLYICIQFFNNFGPNATTFILAAEVFPTRFRSTAHGIAAASGKAGAILAAQGFSSLKDVGGAPGSGAFIPQLLWIFCFCMALGYLFTFWVPETKGKSLEEIVQEREKIAARKATDYIELE